MTGLKRKYAWRPNLPDRRDVPYMVTRRTGNLPKSVDLRINCSPIDDQGSLGSCTGHAIAGALEYYAQRAGHPAYFSRLFIYYEERRIEHTIKSDAGAMIRDGMKVVTKIGAPHEKLWPYDITKFTRKPTVRAYADAAKHKALSYHRVPNLDTVRAELAAGNPVVFGFTVYDSFESDEVARTGHVPMPLADERCLGGHAVVAVGYHDVLRALLVRNSWGAEWGLKGYFFLPYAYAIDPDLAGDFSVVRV